jgi:hypothetical protein
MVFQPKESATVYNLDVAYGIAKEKLAKADVRLQCERSGAELQPDGSVRLKCLNHFYRIDVTKATMASEAKEQRISLRDTIMLLHYFTQAKGTPLSKKQITYRELPGGLVYFPTFQKRTVEPLVEFFGERPPLLFKAGATVGGTNAFMSDASLVIPAFPRVPVTLLIWRGDGELPPGGNLVFDASITDYLESEDVTVICEAMTWRLINYARSL